MLGSVEGCTAAERWTTCNALSPVAAWFLRRSDGRLRLSVNQAHCETHGACHYAESWFRLNAIVRGRAFGVLLATEILETAALMADLSHTV